jgi:glyoxylate reductase
MNRRKILVTHPLPDDLLTEFADKIDLIPGFKTGANKDVVAQGLGCQALLVGPGTPLLRDHLSALLPSLEMISSFSSGVENIDLDAARELGIAVTNSGSAVAAPTAEIAMLLMLGVARQAGPGYELVKRGNWEGMAKHPPSGFPLEGRTLGIVGMGNIGRAVAHRARAFGMRVVYHNRQPLAGGLAGDALYCATLEALLGCSDVVTLHCPLTDLTREMINVKTLAQMQPGSVLINTARGELLRDEDVVLALDNGRLAGLGLDVYAGEPDIHAVYRTSDKVFTLPHIGTATAESRRNMGRLALQNLVSYFSGEATPDLLVPGRARRE